MGTVLPFTRAQAEHAQEVTLLLQEDDPPLGLDYTEAICPACSLAFFVTDRDHSWGMCRECFEVALAKVPPS